MTRFAIIEDNPQYLKVLKTVIGSHPDYRSECSYVDAESFLADINEEDIDIVLIDIQLPGMQGYELVYHIRKLRPEIKILICSSYDDDEKIFRSLQHGANGYILKSSTPDQILEAIHDLQTGGAPMSQSIAKKVVLFFYTKASEKESLDILTKKENEILSLLSEGLLYKEIPDKAGCSLETVKKHCTNIYKKLQVNNRTEALKIYFSK